MVELLAGVLTGGLGGVTGLLGSMFQAWNENKKQGISNEHELKLREMDLQAYRVEAETAQARTAIELEGRIEASAAEAFAKSQAAGAKTIKRWSATNTMVEPLLALVDVLRGLADVLRILVRPVLTGFLVWQVVSFYETASPEAKMNIILTWLYLMTTAVSWWFGTRHLSKQPKLPKV